MNLPIGELAALGAAGAWAVSSVLFALERANARPIVMTLLKGTIAIVFFALLVAVMKLSGAVIHLPGIKPVLVLAFSAVCGITIGDTCFFGSMVRIGVRKASLLSLLNPIVAAFLALAFGQELPSMVGFVGIAVTLLGVVLVVAASPGDRAADPHLVSGTLLGVASGVCNAIGIVSAKSAIAAVGVVPTALVRQVAAFAALLAFELVVRRGRDLRLEMGDGYRRPRLLFASLAGSCFGFLLFQVAIDRASPPITGTLSSTVPLFIAPLAVRYLGERLPARAALGTVIAVAGVVLMVCF